MTTGRRGPAPEPAVRKKAKGNPGKRPIPEEIEIGAGSLHGAGLAGTDSDGEGGAASAVPTIPPPEWLNEDGLTVWNRLAPRLASMKILQSIDADTFARYCQNFGRWVRLQRTLDEEGETYVSESAHGTYTRSHPAFMQAQRLDRDLMMQEASFALNPADRQRLFAARAAAAGAGGADLFGSSGGEAGERKPTKPAPDGPQSPVGMLN